MIGMKMNFTELCGKTQLKIITGCIVLKTAGYDSGEGNEDGSWWWRQDIEDWVFSHEDDNGNQWLYGNSEQAWGKDSASSGNWNWLGQEEQVNEPAQEATNFADMVEAKTDDLSDKIQTQVGDKIEAKMDQVGEKQGIIEFGDLEEKIASKVDSVQEKVQERAPKCRTVSKGPFEFEICNKII